LAAKRVACPECSANVPYGRLSCPTCGTLLASVAGSTRRVSLRPNGRRSKGPHGQAARPAGPELPLRAGQDDAGTSSAFGAWLEARLKGEPKPHQGYARRGFDSVRAMSAETDGALALALDHPTNGLAPETEMASVLHDWDEGSSSVATWESPTTWDSVSTRAGQTVRDFMTSAASVVATIGRTSSEHSAPEAGPRQIPGAYLAPSATRVVELHPELRRGRIPTAPSARAVPGLNQWYSVPDTSGGRGAPAVPTPSPTASPVGHAAVPGFARPESAAPALVPGHAGVPSDLALTTPNGPSGWATAVGSGLAAVSVVLPWAKNGVAGGQLGPGYLAQWGLANPAYLLLLAAGLSLLLVTILPNRLPQALREVALPLLLGGFLFGLAWSYATGPFGTGMGVGTMVLGAGFVVTGGVLGLRGFRANIDSGDTPA
jgi:hypothetical protein